MWIKSLQCQEVQPSPFMHCLHHWVGAVHYWMCTDVEKVNGFWFSSPLRKEVGLWKHSSGSPKSEISSFIVFNLFPWPILLPDFNPFPAVYEFILVFPSAANKYICFIFLIPSLPATNIFVETINVPAHAHNSNRHFQCLEYFQQFEIYCILWLFSTFTSILVSIVYIFNF